MSFHVTRKPILANIPNLQQIDQFKVAIPMAIPEALRSKSAHLKLSHKNVYDPNIRFYMSRSAKHHHLNTL